MKKQYENKIMSPTMVHDKSKKVKKDRKVYETK
jgi:hypothetical protein